MVKSTKRILALVMAVAMVMTGMDLAFVKKAYAEGNTFRIYYHEDVDSAANEMYTDVEYMVSTKTLTAAELGYSREGFLLKAWNINRESDGKWAYNVDGKLVWADECPEGGTLYELTAGSQVSKLVNPGVVVHFYGVWVVDYFTIRYHLDESTDASDTVTNVKYGVSTKTLTAGELGYSKEGLILAGWTARREQDGKWAYTNNGTDVTWLSEPTEGYDLYLYDANGQVAKTVLPGNTAHFYGYWIKEGLDVTDSLFGANGTDDSDDANAIQKALNLGKDNDVEITVKIPAGTYYISRALKIYSNTNLELSEDTTIVRMYDDKEMLRGTQGSGELLGEYEQVKNVTVSGGTWDGNVKDTTLMSDLIRFNHCYNITIKDCTIKGYCGRHMVTLAGVNKLLVENVTFRDAYVYTGDNKELCYPYKNADGDIDYYNSMRTMEALHIDCITEDGTTEGSAWPCDGTICTDVTVTNCTFKNLFSGVGNHALIENKGNKFDITGNKFTDIQYMCIDTYNYENANISDNRAENVSCFMMFANSSGTVDNNEVIITTNETDHKGFCGIHCFYSNYVDIQNNNISNAIYNGILVADSEGINCSTNTINNSDGNTIVYSRSKNCKVRDNTISNGLIGISVTDSKVDVESNIINNADGHGIGIYNDSESRIIDNTITDNTGNGINVSGSKVYVSSNTVNNPGATGIILYKCKDYTDCFSNNIVNNIITKTTYTGIFVDDSKSKCIGENEIYNPGARGISLANESVVDSIISNVVRGAGEHGINLTNSKAVVEENKVYASGHHGIMIQGVSNADVKVNTVTDARGNGISVNTSTANIINNQVNNSQVAGIYAKSDIGTEESLIVVSDNTVSETGGMGIQFDSCSYMEVKNNNVSQTNSYGIQSYNSSEMKISDNTIADATNFGIQCHTSENVEITGNNVKNSTQHGIVAYFSDGVGISKNTVTYSGGKDICANNSSTGYASGNRVSSAGCWTYSDESFPMTDNLGAIETCIVSDIEAVEYTGEEIRPEVTVTFGSKVLKCGEDYELVYSNNIELGDEATVTVKGIGAYDGSITKNFSIVKKEEPLTVKISVDNNTVKVGEYVTLTATATGGSGNYTYSFLVWNTETDEWYRFNTLFNSVNTLTWKASTVGTRKFYVEVKDDTGKVVRSKAVSVTPVEEVTPLAITATTSNANPAVGETIAIVATATGGKGNYTYSFLVWNRETDEWYRFNSVFNTANTLTWKATTAGTRRFYAEVKDDTEEVVRSSAVSVNVK